MNSFLSKIHNIHIQSKLIYSSFINSSVYKLTQAETSGIKTKS